MALFAQSFTEDLFVKGLRRLTPAERKPTLSFSRFVLHRCRPFFVSGWPRVTPRQAKTRSMSGVMRGLYAAMDKDLLQDFLSARSRAVLAEIRAFPAVAKVSGGERAARGATR